ncbi:MAG: protein-L-isoaspartate(D-aspartate) O-methyltransferase [Opitutaceae bacterium]|nr:protein-L-isoaspartate(D-aspartate) O-methyltransferase [Cytophagales bacterium]
MIIDDYKHKGLRKKLVKELQGKGIYDQAVLDSILNVPRHIFLDTAFLEQAYTDKAFQIGEGQTISQPYTVAFQTQLLEIKKGEKVLEIGTGSGYQASVLCYMETKLYSIERIKSLSKNASLIFQKLGYKPELMVGDGSLGWKVHSPFQKIIVTAGAPLAPEPLLEQLDLGGILVIPIGDQKVQTMVRYKKDLTGKITKEEHGIFKFVPLLGEKAWKTTQKI